MMLFPSSNLIFFAIPKTGSTAFEQTFEREIPDTIVVPKDRKHMNVRQFEYNKFDAQISQDGEQMERMAILREPLARLHSWFRFRQRLDSTHQNSTKDLSFENFIVSTMQHSPPTYARNIGDQWKFCTRKNGELGITHLFDIANLQPLDDFLQDRLGRRFPRERINESKVRKIVISSEVESKLRDHRFREFALYASVVENGGYLATDFQV